MQTTIRASISASIHASAPITRRTGLLIAALCLSSAALAQGSLSGSVDSSTTSVNLSTQGSTDWAHWGTGGVPGLVRKSGGSLISTYIVVGAGGVSTYSNDPRPMSWSGGSPTATASADASGLYISNIGNGFSITVPADTTQRVVKVYVGGWNSAGSFTASLSDASATNYTNTTTASTTQYDRAYTLTYKAASAGKLLTLTWVQSSSTGNVTLNAVALAADTTAPASLPAVPSSPTPVVNYEYDAQGNPTKVVQAPGVSGFGFESKASYDPLSRVKDTTDPKLGKTQLQYDGGDRTTQVTDPRNLVTQYPRDGLGQATQLISPDTGTASHTYDAAGNLTTRTDSRGVLTTNTYDVLNRLTSTVYSKTGMTTQTYGWAYDQTGAGYANGVGRLTSTTHPSGSTRYSYDPQGRLVTDTQGVSAAAGANGTPISTTVSYGYDAAGHLTSLVYPSGRKLIVTYTDGQPSAMSLAKDASSTPVNLITGLAFEPFGGVTTWQWQLNTGTQGNDKVYDTSGRLVRYRLGNIIRDLSYDAADRITAYTHYDATSAAPQTSLGQGFGYDANGQLTTITTATASWTITYDANGNRTGVTLNGTPSTYTTETTSNRLSSTTSPARSFGYDSTGNTTSDSGGYTATYDASGRLATITKAGVTTTYSHNGLGQRIRKFSSTGASSTTLFVYDQQGQLLGEYDSTGKALREYIYLGDTPVAMFTPDPANAANPPIAFYVHTDHLNTPRVVTDTAGNIRWRWIAEPFGTTAPETNPSNLGVFTQPLRFPGQYADAESGLSDNWYRSYDSTLGRYNTSDPIGLGGGINTFAYVGGNPLSFVDPNGLAEVRVCVNGACIGPPPMVTPSLPSEMPPGQNGAPSRDRSRDRDAGRDRPAPEPSPPQATPIPPQSAPSPAGPVTMPAAPGNVADTQIVQDYNRYASEVRLCGGKPDDPCEWLKKNASKYSEKRVKATEKAWGCRRSRWNR